MNLQFLLDKAIECMVLCCDNYKDTPSTENRQNIIETAEAMTQLIMAQNVMEEMGCSELTN